MKKILTIILALATLLSAKSIFAQNYCTKTKDYQFVIYSADKKLTVSTEKIADNYPKILKESLNIFFTWEIPAQIYIYSLLDWEPQTPYTIKNEGHEKKIKLCALGNAETKAVFPAITALILSEIIREENHIEKIEDSGIKIPMWLTEGLWRHLTKFNTDKKLHLIQDLNLRNLTKTEFSKLTAKEKELFLIKSALLIDYMLYLPYGSIKLRNIIVDTYKKKPKKHARIIYRAYGEYFKNEDDFNKKWKKYLDAKILSAQIF